MKKKFNISEIYPNSSLVEVVCEIRFPAELAIECKRDEFFEKIRDKYPLIMIPQTGKNPSNFLAQLRFENSNNTAGIIIGIDRFSFYEKDYSGHKLFISKFLKLVEILRKTYSIKKLIRIGWRYINVIPFTRENGIVPLQRFVNIAVKLPNGMSDQFENLSIVFMSKVPEGTITTRIEPMIRPDDQQEALIMDFDLGMTEKISFSRIGVNVRKHTNKPGLYLKI